MLLVLGLALGLWLLGGRMHVPKVQRAALIAFLFALVGFFQLVLAPDNPLRVATGGSLANWSVMVLLSTLFVGYRLILSRLHARAARRAQDHPARASGGTAEGAAEGVAEGQTAAAADGDDRFTSGELDRYARHIMLRELGGPGQKRLKKARVLVVGAGGLGSPALLYLAASGVGTIGVIDDDTVEASNLQRQIIHRDDTVGLPKVFSAERAMKALNPYVRVRPYHRRLDEDIAQELIGDYDLVLDGTDSQQTRYLVNRACVAQGVPLISAAITQWEGQISLYHPASGGPCYRCVFPAAAADGLAPSCAEAGVAAPLPGVIGAMMATEAVKHIAGAGRTLAGRLMLYDALYADTRTIRIARRADCPDCAGKP